jgi:hypothetical protein
MAKPSPTTAAVDLARTILLLVVVAVIVGGAMFFELRNPAHRKPVECPCRTYAKNGSPQCCWQCPCAEGVKKQ